ncbi:MAG TPA: aminotransferase [Synergistaceae bacterium]|nr:aminotransferase [Synergistaceae bacterium]NLL40742.1 aminotransferase [Synergistaceae bacterium]HPX03201.1 aminotransferase [Synergistaceae bacterium]HQA55158.1 aminotransferase [Synergistaceae bacterium]
MEIKTFEVEEWMNKYEDDATYNIAETCVESLKVRELLDIASVDKDEFFQKISETKLTYGAIPGSVGLREEITKLYHKKKTIDNIIVTNGGIGANFLALFSLVGPGDEVVALYPTYQQLYSLPEALGAKVRRLRLEPEDGYMPDTNKLRTLVKSNTRAIVINTPNNPTGACFGEAVMKEIAAIADRVGAWVVCDEVYRGLEHDGSYTVPSIADIYEKGVSTSSMSKVYSLAGLRLGWIAADEAFIKECFKHRDYNIISCGMLDDALALTALKNKEKILERNLKIIRENKKILTDWVESTDGLSFVPPKAGTTALIKYDFDMESEEFCRKMFEYNGAFVVPGSCFEFENHFRIGYAPKKEVLNEGLAAVASFIKTL